MKIKVECSPEQMEIIADYFIYDSELGILPDEKQWILSRVRKMHPHCKILKVELDIDCAEWILEIEL